MTSTTPERLYRPRSSEYFEAGVVARLDATHNIVEYNKEFFDLKDSTDFGTLRRMNTAYLFATTEQ